MTDILYHGSIIPGIINLEARSRLHATEQMVAYLTDSIPYALFYIWDAAHTGYSSKYVTGGFRDGLVFYEEQFPDQLRTFYQGVSGYLYRISASEAVHPVEHRDGLYYHIENAPVAETIFIPDVYAELLKYEAAGQLKVLRFSEQTDVRKAELTSMIAEYIRKNNFFDGGEEQRQFMQKYFPAAWRQAHEQTD